MHLTKIGYILLAILGMIGHTLAMIITYLSVDKWHIAYELNPLSHLLGTTTPFYVIVYIIALLIYILFYYFLCHIDDKGIQTQLSLTAIIITAFLWFDAIRDMFVLHLI